MFIAFLIAAGIGGYIADKKGEWIGLFVGIVIFAVGVMIVGSADKKKHEEEIQKCNAYMENPYYPLDIESIGYEYASKGSNYCDLYNFDIEELAYSNDNYLKGQLVFGCTSKEGYKFIECVEYNISKFEDGCEEYDSRKSLKKQCLEKEDKRWRE